MRPEFWGSTHFTPSSYFTKAIFTATSPLHKPHPLTPTFFPSHCTQLPGSLQSEVPADLGLQCVYLGADLGPELVLVLGTSWPLSGPYSLCGPFCSPVSLDVPLGCPSRGGMGLSAQCFWLFWNFQNFNLGFLNLKHMCFYTYLCKRVFYRSIHIFIILKNDLCSKT